MPRVSVPELSYAYDKGIITWEAFQRQLATFCGIQSEDLAPKQEEWDRDERFAMLTGGSNKMSMSEPQTEFKKSSQGHGL